MNICELGCNASWLRLTRFTLVAALLGTSLEGQAKTIALTGGLKLLLGNTSNGECVFSTESETKIAFDIGDDSMNSKDFTVEVADADGNVVSTAVWLVFSKAGDRRDLYYAIYQTDSNHPEASGYTILEPGQIFQIPRIHLRTPIDTTGTSFDCGLASLKIDHLNLETAD